MLSIAPTLLIEDVSRCLTCVVSDTDTCDYIDLYHFLKILWCYVFVSMLCPVSVRYMLVSNMTHDHNDLCSFLKLSVWMY
jgi:hypothetical protein